MDREIKGKLGGSPGLVVMEGDKCSNPSTRYILDKHFSHSFFVKKISNVCLKKT